MIKELSLTNFGRHEDLTVNFLPGLNVLRAANEAGKSTLFYAVAYALYGARALPMSLDDTVTWGKPVGSLRVSLTFDHLGVPYSVIRKKSGAELLGPDGLRVSGHSEVTGFTERLFNASINVAVSTMIVGQGQLKDTLDSSAMSLIEQLANMGLIDSLVDKIQTQKPCGNTKLFEQQLQGLADLVRPVADFTEQDAALLAAECAEYAAEDAVDEATASYSQALTEAQEAAQRLEQAKLTSQHHATLVKQLQQVSVDAKKPAPVNPEPLTRGELLNLQDLQEAEKVTAAKWAQFQTIAVPATSVPREYMLLELSSCRARSTTALNNIRQAELDMATAKALRVTQTACGLCGKDLSEVPEVVSTNKKHEAVITSCTDIIDVQRVVLNSCLNTISKIEKLLSSDNILRLAVSRLDGYVELDESNLPATPVWVGPARSSEVDLTDYTARLRDLQAFTAKFASWLTLQSSAVVSLEKLDRELADFVVVQALPNDSKAAANAAEKLRDMQTATAECNAASKCLSAARHRRDLAGKDHDFKVKAYDDAVARRAELTAMLESYAVHNKLIKKLREARPVVAKRLWNTVLTAVSTYFSTIRGCVSTVTRSNTGFLIDGKPVAAFSGSTKDALGLSIRVTLQKTFLGAMDFMLADEIASAADPVRESAMLGMLATCGFGQVVLVTHSDIADSFATNIIRI